MYPNLKAEQSRRGLTNQAVADALGMPRTTYEYKKRTGRFNVSESKVLCNLFSCKFEYLFSEAVKQ